MRKYIPFLILGIVIYMLSQSLAVAIDTEECKDCHVIKPIPKEDITKGCSACHGMHSSSPEPGIRNPERVHDIHKDAQLGLRQNACFRCHQSPVECRNCHNSHENIEEVMKEIMRSRIIGGNISNISNENISKDISISISCTECHGNLPQPKGHEEFRDALSNSKHKWMTCNTCHLNPYSIGDDYKFDLHFKTLLTTPIDDSIKLCKICHSSIYEKMITGNHGEQNKTCINCHNPHTTQLTGPKFQIKPTETEKPTNISTKFSESKKWLFEKVPILNNPTLMMIIIILIFVFVSEHILSKHEEGQKVAYNMVKFKAGEDILKTLEVKLKGDFNSVSQIVKDYGNILGMTMVTEKDKDSSDTYKYIIFINLNKPMDETEENEFIGKISSIGDIMSVEFTDKYEL